VNRARFRIMILVLTASLAAVVALAVALAPGGVEPELPGPLEEVFPLPGDAVVRQTAIQIDLPIGYAVEIEVDGIWIPPHEIGLTDATGLYRWQPNAESVLPFWEPGDHTVTARWERISGGRPDVGEFTWTFRVF
jgi:hypothetical protein